MVGGYLVMLSTVNVWHMCEGFLCILQLHCLHAICIFTYEKTNVRTVNDSFCLAILLQSGDNFLPYRMPKSSMLFVPPRTKTDMLNPMEFMGRAKVRSTQPKRLAVASTPTRSQVMLRLLSLS